MKISGKFYKEIEQKFNSAMENHKEEVFKKLEQHKANEKIKNPLRALLWDILFSINKGFSEELRKFLNDCNDSHIETALRKIGQPFGLNWIGK